MKTFKFSFIGRQSRAIGITYPIVDSYRCSNIDEAMCLLYEDYEHILRLSCVSGGVRQEIPSTINLTRVRPHTERDTKENGEYFTHRVK